MSVFDDGTDLADPVAPATETRGGENPDWANARPGEPLPEKQPDPDIVRGIERVTGERYGQQTGEWS